MTGTVTVTWQNAAGMDFPANADTPLPVTNGGSGTTAQQVQGNVAHDAVDSGNPVKIGGYAYDGTPTAVANGDRVNAWYNRNGAAVVAGKSVTAGDGDSNGLMDFPDLDGNIRKLWVAPSVFNGTTWDRMRGTTVGTSTYSTTSDTGTDGRTNNLNMSIDSGGNPRLTAFAGSVFNGTTWDRQRNNVDTAALSTFTATGASTVTSSDQTNYNGRGVQVLINLTTVTTATVTVKIQGKDAASGVYYDILTSAALATAAATNLTAYPGTAVVANLAIGVPLPRVWRVSTEIVGVSAAVTGTIGASVIV